MIVVRNRNGIIIHCLMSPDQFQISELLSSAKSDHCIYCIFLEVKDIVLVIYLLYWLLLGKADDKTGCLKSVMAIYLFRKKVADFKEGLDFSTSLVEPEIDATTGGKLHQREDHNHLLKRIVGCIREGKIPGFNVVYLRDALHDPGNHS